MLVPVNNTVPSNRSLSLARKETSSSSFRFNSLVLASLLTTISPSRYILQTMLNAYGFCTVSARRMAGPIEQELRHIFACGRYSGFSPSISRQLMSLPTIYPTMLPSAASTNPSSGSGICQLESLRSVTASSGPIVRAAVDLKRSPVFRHHKLYRKRSLHPACLPLLHNFALRGCADKSHPPPILPELPME